MVRAKTESSFEKDLEQLEQIVMALEEGGLPLEDSLKRFEEGIKLSRRCEKALSEAEKKIEILLKNESGELEAQPFGDKPVADAAAPGVSEPAAPPAEKRSKARDPYEELPPESEDEEGGMLF